MPPDPARARSCHTIPIATPTWPGNRASQVESARRVRYHRFEAVRAALGRGNPYERFGAGRCGAALLDLMVGEPVAYETGSPELKAMGPPRTVSNSPITKCQRGIVCGGVPQTTALRGAMVWPRADDSPTKRLPPAQ